ncbi:fatty acid synthase alpha subunit Lsd1 [Entomophthora muscae]|uniref:Fatty acid synthase alpha subunit Lsd1 n=1 Tax=Entomophthora muscae TaxID=34485 RepID=A0ACC2RX14_9FUNG|nr:fatty acid synthase alpha subunit Lsd1 [Entomophthora muscae]
MNQVVINQNSAFIAKASDDKSLIKNSKKALGSLFWIGTHDQQIYPLVTLNSAICKYSIINGKRNLSSILAIYNLQLGEFKQLFNIINHHLSKEHNIFIKLLNDPHFSACVVHPQRLNDLNLVLHKVKASGSLDLFCAPHSNSPVTHMISIGPVGTSGIDGLTYLIKWQPILNFRNDCFIKKFNGYSQKPWDRCKSDESTFDFLDKTYVDVDNRLIEDTYIKHQQHYLKITLCHLVGDFMGILEELFITKHKHSLLQSYHKSGKQLLIIKDTIFSWSCKIIASLLKVYDTKDGCLALEAVFNSLEPTKGYAFIHDVIKGCNNHIKYFYYQLWFKSAEFSELSIDPHHTLVAKAVADQVKV